MSEMNHRYLSNEARDKELEEGRARQARFSGGFNIKIGVHTIADLVYILQDFPVNARIIEISDDWLSYYIPLNEEPVYTEEHIERNRQWHEKLKNQDPY